MKITIYLLASFLLISFIGSGALSSRRDNNEVIVRLAGDFFELPEGKVEASFKQIKISSPSLHDFLTSHGVTKIARVYPDFTKEDSIIISAQGLKVRVGDLTRVFVLKFETAEGKIEFLDGVKTPASVKTQTSLVNKLIRSKNIGNSSAKEILEQIMREPGIRKIISRHQQHPEILLAEPNTVGQYYADPPNDPLWAKQWALRGNGIIASIAWDYQISTARSIGILDCGLINHRDLQFTGYQTSPMHWHGTAVAGIVASKTDNNLDMAGVLRGPTTLISINAGEGAQVDSMANALNNAIATVGIMNLSSGVTGDEPTELARATKNALNADALVVCANGNEGSSASHPGKRAFGVGATTKEGWVADYSNSYPDVVAPGGVGQSGSDDDNIWTLFTYEPWTFSAWGTSFAAPHATGTAGLISGYMRDNYGWFHVTRDDLQRIMEITAYDIYPEGYDSRSGWGRVRASEALKKIEISGHNRLKHLTASGYDWYEESDIYPMSCFDVGDLAPGTYYVKRYICYKNVQWGHPCVEIPYVWGNNAFTLGYEDECPQYGQFACNVVEGSVTLSSATLKTTIYDMWDFGFDPCGMYPCEPHEISYSYSVLGEFNLFQPSVAVNLAQNGDSHYFQVTWSDSNEFHEGYQLQYARGTPSVWTTLAELEPSCHNYNYTPFWGSQMYYFRVRATWGTSHVSEWSNDVGIRNVPNPPTDIGVSLEVVCGWPDVPKTVSISDDQPGSESNDQPVSPYMSQTTKEGSVLCAPEPPPLPPCSPTNLAYVSWDSPENQVEPVDYYKVRLLLYLGGEPTVYLVGPFTAQACTLCLWPGHEYRLSVVSYKYGLHSDETVGTQVFTSGEAIACSDYSHKGSPPQAPEPQEPDISNNMVSGDRCLIQNHPNPFNPETDISYLLPEDCMVSLVVYNMLGQRVRVLVNEPQNVGLKTVHWDGKDDYGNDLASGVYFCRLLAGNHDECRKMVLMR